MRAWDTRGILRESAHMQATCATTFSATSLSSIRCAGSRAHEPRCHRARGRRQKSGALRSLPAGRVPRQCSDDGKPRRDLFGRSNYLHFQRVKTNETNSMAVGGRHNLGDSGSFQSSVSVDCESRGAPYGEASRLACAPCGGVRCFRCSAPRCGVWLPHAPMRRIVQCAS